MVLDLNGKRIPMIRLFSELIPHSTDREFDPDDKRTPFPFDHFRFCVHPTSDIHDG
jgi:hypothetical protein